MLFKKGQIVHLSNSNGKAKEENRNIDHASSHIMVFSHNWLITSFQLKRVKCFDAEIHNEALCFTLSHDLFLLYFFLNFSFILPNHKIQH